MFITSAKPVNRNYKNVSLSSVLKDLSSISGDYTINFIYNDLEDYIIDKTINTKHFPKLYLRLLEITLLECP